MRCSRPHAVGHARRAKPGPLFFCLTHELPGEAGQAAGLRRSQPAHVQGVGTQPIPVQPVRILEYAVEQHAVFQPAHGRLALGAGLVMPGHDLIYPLVIGKPACPAKVPVIVRCPAAVAHADWQFVGVYADEGISGLNTKNRDGFNRMVADALDGKIDLIVTKSVSRFARNTVDSLTIIRKLKDAGCECFFEKENIYTFDGKGELLLTIMSSLAQEESRSISENVTWGQRKRFADGKVSLPYGHFLGYEKGPDGLPQIVPEEAEIVRDIYRMFMGGLSTNAIAKRLTGQAIPTPAGKDTWRRQTVESILRNEKYKGSALLQKRFTVDFLQKKMKVNEGEVPQYYVEHSHPAIILPEEWEKVQLELARRRDSDRRTHANKDCRFWRPPYRLGSPRGTLTARGKEKRP